MNKKKLLIENFIVYGLGQIIYKIVPIAMIPILVRLLPNSSYYLGINDLFNIIVSLTAVVGLMGLYDAVFRLFFDYTDQQIGARQELCSTALLLTACFSAVWFFLLVIFRKEISILFFENEQLTGLVILCGINVLLTNVENILLTPTRMMNERKRFIFGNTIISIFSYSVALILVHCGHYIVALPLGMTLSLLIGIIYYGICNRKWFHLFSFSASLIVPLLKIGVPLFPTFIIFWVFSSFDKVMILKILDVNANGLFSVAGKLAQVSHLITAAFAAGWSYFNFATMQDKARVKDFSKIMECIMALGIVTFLICRVLGNFVMRVCFTAEYANLGDVFAYLFLAPISSMIFQLMSSQFLLIKKTILSTFIAGGGVVINIFLNYLWINAYNILGASMATVVSYILIVITASIVLKCKKMIEITYREICILVAFGVVLCMDLLRLNIEYIYILCIVFAIGLAALYVKEFLLLIKGEKA